jgi:hypothetical protein
MIRKHFRRKRLILGLAVVALAAPVSAQAMVAVDGPTGGEQAYVIPKSRGIVVQSPAQAAAYQLKVDVMRGQALNKTWAASKSSPTPTNLGPLDPWAYAAIHSHDAVPTVVTITRTSDGFNWSDAGIGSAVTFGVALFLLTAVGLGRKYRGRLDRSGLARA